jgi:hypothetical protein
MLRRRLQPVKPLTAEPRGQLERRAIAMTAQEAWDVIGSALVAHVDGRRYGFASIG